jgi:hypothetical protein
MKTLAAAFHEFCAAVALAPKYVLKLDVKVGVMMRPDPALVIMLGVEVSKLSDPDPWPVAALPTLATPKAVAAGASKGVAIVMSAWTGATGMRARPQMTMKKFFRKVTFMAKADGTSKSRIPLFFIKNPFLIYQRPTIARVTNKNV